MFEDEAVLDWCIENNVSVTQYLFMFFLIERSFHKPFHESYAKRYVKKFEMFKLEDVIDLVDRGFIEDYNTKGESRPEFYAVRDEIIEFMKATNDQAEELWNAYPPTFELPNGRFNSRHAGILGEKDNAKKVYLKKIKRSKRKHKFVIKMLKKYLSLVEANLMNSMKLGDWIANEMWDAVDETNEEEDYGIEIR